MTQAQAYLIYDERMELHEDQNEESYQVERPERIVSIIEQLMCLQSRLEKYRNKYPFISLQCEPASQAVIELAHSTDYYNSVKETSSMSIEELKSFPTIDCSIENDFKNIENDEDMYFCKDTFQAALLACGGVTKCVDAVFSPSAETNRALAIVRPPGHHACRAKSMGFCFFNSVVVAAKYAIQSQRAKRVAIIDIDVHHGNGSQDLSYDDADILYISLHRIGKDFFPGTGRPSEVGGHWDKPEAIGSNVNIAWTKAHMGNIEYAAAMSELVLPLLQQSGADLVLISCGLDAAKGDLIGDCDLTPKMYYDMTASMLKTLGDEIPFIVALEGGYNLDVIAACMEAVSLAVLDESWDEDGSALEREDSLCTEEDPALCLRYGRKVLASYWDHFAVDVRQKGRIKASALKDINATIRCIRDTPFWKGHIELKEIPSQRKFPQAGLSQMTTRSRSKPKDVESIDSLDEYLQSLQI